MEAGSLYCGIGAVSETPLWKLTSTSCAAVTAIAIAVAATIVAATSTAMAAVPAICSIGS